MTREIQLTRGRVALVDDADFETLSAHRWRLEGSDDRSRGLYATTTIDGSVVRMHRLLMGAAPGQPIDHKNHDGLDNRRGNLRICTTQENARNRRANRNSRAGLKGVAVQRGKFQAAICVDGRQEFLGVFKNKYVAGLAYDDAAVARFGDFAELNFDRSRDWLIAGRSIGAGADLETWARATLRGRGR